MVYASLAVHSILVSSMYGNPIHRRQGSDLPEPERGLFYILDMCGPDTRRLVESQEFEGEIFPHLANSSFPCDQLDYILGSCSANATNPAVDFAAEQQCLCGSNLVDAWNGCQDCWRARGFRLGNETLEKLYISSLFTAECTPSPYPTIPFGNLRNIPTTMPTTRSPKLTLAEDKFPNQTAASLYWTSNLHVTPTIGVITGIATGRATVMTAPFEIYTPSGSVSTSMGSSVVTSSPSTTSPPSGSAGVSTTSSTAGIGEMGVASGVVFVVVNVVAVMLL
ncbi:hypothetical protein IFR04_013067 [Cadophora malorum]|uniref:Uncharacterized protein n=1 Tax=Cadophora malorum TaxID=108018 RepID=A0A8H7T7B1_9HELO|nr:hypothetical protein IFR04_013067 [Cadophora malorum]